MWSILSVFFSSKCSFFHSANLFGSCIIHILYIGVLKLKKNNNSGAKGLSAVTEKSGSLLAWQGASLGCGWRYGPQYGGWMLIYWISIRRQPTKGGPAAWGLGKVLTTPHRKNVSCYALFCLNNAFDLDWFYGAAYTVEKDMKIGTWNLYRCTVHFVESLL